MNEAKEKAQELVEKYLNTIIQFPYIDSEDGNCIGTGYMTHNSDVLLMRLMQYLNQDH